jgi:hypothetical protein
MRSTLHLAAATGLSLLATGALAARACGTTGFTWRVLDARYDSAEDGTAAVSVSIAPGNIGSFFECHAEWPAAWAGWYDKNSIVWGDCIWTGAGPTYDKSISFAVDWKNQTMYLAHVYTCSNKNG